MIEKIKSGKFSSLYEDTNATVSLFEIPIQSEIENKIILVNTLIGLGYTGIYVTTGKTCTDLQKVMKESNIEIDNLRFVDVISEMYGIKRDSDSNCIYITSPLNLDGIREAILTQISNLSGQKKFLIFDSLTTILLYNSMAVVVSFAEKLCEILRKDKMNGILVSIARGDKNIKLKDKVGQIVDKAYVIIE